MSGHRRDAKIQPNRHVYIHLNEIGWNNVRIVLIEAVICLNKDELVRHEQRYIDELKPSLNKYSAVDTCTHGKRQRQCVQCNG